MFRATSLFLPLLSGILLSLSLPFAGAWPLVWVALVPYFIFATNSALTYGRLLSGTLLFGVLYTTLIVFPLIRISGWWWSGDSIFLGVPQTVEYAVMVFLVGVWGALFFIPVALALRATSEKWYAVLAVPVVWVIAEWLRTLALFGMSWGTLGYALIDTRYVKLLASFGEHLFVPGVFLLSFFAVLANVSLVEFLRILSVRSGGLLSRLGNAGRVYAEDRRLLLGLPLFFFSLLALIIFGLYDERKISPSETSLKVAVIGSSLRTEESLGEGSYRYYRARLRNALLADADLVVFPENAFPYFELDIASGELTKRPFVPLPEREVLYQDLLALSREFPKARIVLGIHTLSEGGRYNSLVVYENGAPRAYYHKRTLVPFVEYAPFDMDVPIVERLQAGESVQYLDIGYRATAMMCSEVGDSGIAANEADIILSPSNDSVFAGPWAGEMHHSLARMRALESGAYMLRAVKGGISSVIAPDGEVIASGKGEVLFAEISLP